MTDSVLIIGYGNTLCGDDGVGWLAAEALEAASQPDRVRIIACHQLTIDLAPDIAQADCVVFIDARLGDSPGRIECSVITADYDALSPLEHHVKPQSLLTTCKVLFGYVPDACLLTIQSQSFQPCSGLSDEIQQAWPKLLEAATTLIASSSLEARPSIES